MEIMTLQPARVALLDMYEGTANLGMANLDKILRCFKKELSCEVFDVRSEIRLPSLEDYDIYIFSGGPGNPLVGDEQWLRPFHELIRQLWEHNRNPGNPRKFAFFICHSFQMACHHFGIGSISRRREKSFGIFPVHKTTFGQNEWVFSALPDPFYVGDFREFQVINPNEARMEELGAELLCVEKVPERPGFQRAMMAVRFSDEMVGTQFHPEADTVGMKVYFSEEGRIKAVIDEYGAQAYFQMIANLKKPELLEQTFNAVLPTFLRRAIIGSRQDQTVSKF